MLSSDNNFLIFITFIVVIIVDFISIIRIIFVSESQTGHDDEGILWLLSRFRQVQKFLQISQCLHDYKLENELWLRGQ